MMHEFHASVWREGDWFIAQCTEVDVASQGVTEAEALTNLQEALQLHFREPAATVQPHLHSVSIDLNAAPPATIP